MTCVSLRYWQTSAISWTMGLSQPCSFATRRPLSSVLRRLMLLGQTTGSLLASSVPARCRGHVIFVLGSGCAYLATSGRGSRDAGLAGAASAAGDGSAAAARPSRRPRRRRDASKTVGRPTPRGASRRPRGPRARPPPPAAPRPAARRLLLAARAPGAAPSFAVAWRAPSSTDGDAATGRRRSERPDDARRGFAAARGAGLSGPADDGKNACTAARRCATATALGLGSVATALGLGSVLSVALAETGAAQDEC